jgi:Asp-tRNA(Asn)/Glu-tRNA(Gln) amidotransferase B subunit
MQEVLDEAVKLGVQPKLAKLALACLIGLEAKEAGPLLAPLLINIIAPKLEADGMTFEQMDEYHYGFTELLADCACGMHAKVLTHRHVKKIIDDCWNFPYVGYDLFRYIRETNLLDEVEGDALEKILDEVIAANEKAVKEIKAGKDKAIGALVGQVMKKQKVDPAQVKDRLFEKIKAL